MYRSFQINASQRAVVSLNERTIYIKISNSVTYTMYESNVESKELRLSMDLEDIYKIIIKCLEGDEKGNYGVTTSVNSGTMKINFNARVEGFLKISFDIILREKIMSNDGQLTLNFNRLEQQQALAISSLTEKCRNLEESINKMQKIIDCCQIFVSNIYTPQGNWCDLQNNNTTYLTNISAKEITITDHGQIFWKNISVFYQLKKLVINNLNGSNNVSDLSKFGNNTIEELVLNCSSSYASFCSLRGIENFPNLEILTITSAPGLTDVVKTLTETPHKIKTIKFQSCQNVNVVELQTYCQVNNVFLALS